MPSLAVETHAEPPAGWDALARARGAFYHEPAWIAGLAACFGFRAAYVAAKSGGTLAGVLPLLEVPGLLGGRRGVSLPFSYAAGPVVACHGAEAEHVAASLYAGAWDLARRRKLNRLEIKRLAPAGEVPPGYVRTAHYATYRVDTAGGTDAMWNRLHTSTQRSVKKARKVQVHVAAGTTPDEWAAMAALQEQTSHRLGVPAPPRRFFTSLCRELQQRGLAELLLARLSGGAPLAGIVLWKGAREWIYAFGASRPESLEHRPNHLLIWTAAENAAAVGATFDLGRAAPEQEGLVEFKRRWGASPTPLAYDYRPAASGLNVARRDRGALAAAARLWSALPAGVARRGAFLYRYLG